MTQPTALFLADILEDAGKPADIAEKCAAELRRLAAVEAQRDAMQERAEYWKRKHDDEETGAERYALRVQRDELLAALRVFVSCALPVSTEIDERGHRWTEAYLDQALLNARAAIAKAEENT